jgi:diamine N-acetyltransferase
MDIVRTYDHEIIARLNKDVQDIHAALYPNYFKEYDYDSICGFYKQVINNPNFEFLVIKNEDQYLGYAWIEVRESSESVFTKANKFLSKTYEKTPSSSGRG